MSEHMIARVARDWKEYASEPVNVEYIGGAFYGFGSATLRLLKRYRTTDKATQGYSKNRSTFYFCLDTDLAAPSYAQPGLLADEDGAPLFSMA